MPFVIQLLEKAFADQFQQSDQPVLRDTPQTLSRGPMEDSPMSLALEFRLISQMNSSIP
jgi:hypothetical protein